jgi:hypothetical protein
VLEEATHTRHEKIDMDLPLVLPITEAFESSQDSDPTVVSSEELLCEEISGNGYNIHHASDRGPAKRVPVNVVGSESSFGTGLQSFTIPVFEMFTYLGVGFNLRIYTCKFLLSALNFASHSNQYHLNNLKMSVERKITFTARYVARWCQRVQFMYHLRFHSDIGSRTLVLLLAFDFSTSNVYPLPSRQEQHSVVWKYDLSFSIVYFQRFNPCQDSEISEDT